MTKEDWPDIGHTALTWVINSAVMGFKLFVIAGSSDEGSIYGTTDGGFTTKLDEAEARVEGSIKFDGCMNLDLNDGHFCGLAELDNMNECFKRLYRVAVVAGILKEEP